MRALDDRRGEDGAIEYCKHQRGREKKYTRYKKTSAIKCLTSSQVWGSSK